MIKIGIIGCGFMGKMHVNCYRTLQNVRVVGVCDVQQDRAMEIANLAGTKEYLVM